MSALRPSQWIKNLLVLAAPIMSGRVTESTVLAHTALAFVAFSLAASGNYLINDVCDLTADQRHPIKRLRPLAAGQLSVRRALVVGFGLIAASWGVAALVNLDLLLVVGIYALTTCLYSWRLKHEPVLDIAVVASGFLLRAIAGGVASHIALSEWFLLAAAFGSLFMAAGKRYAESLHETPAEFRPALATYTPTYLRFVWTVSAGVLIMTYGLWAFELSEERDSVLPVVSMAPFVLAVLRYAMAIDAGLAGEPTELSLRDRVLQVLAMVWLGLAAAAVYY
jgi:decaprenyl-phosphate phosphoribosyltransferase